MSLSVVPECSLQHRSGCLLFVIAGLASKSPGQLSCGLYDPFFAMNSFELKLREQEGQLEAFFASQDEQVAAEPRRQQTREQQLRTMQLLAEQAAERGAREVVKAVSSGRVPAPEDPAVLSRLTSELMPQRDPRWNETNPDLLASIIAEKPDLIGDLSDLNSVISGLSNAAELARGRQAERTLSLIHI